MGKRLALKHFRIDQKLTQQRMSEILGISKSSYISIENGTRNPTMKFWNELQTNFCIPDEMMFSLFKGEGM